MCWKELKCAQNSSLLLKPTPNLERLGNQFNNSIPENNNDPENISSSKYYDNTETPNKNKSLSPFHANVCSLKHL